MRIITAFFIAVCMAWSAQAGQMDFSRGWKNQRLNLFSSNTYNFGKTLGIESNGTVSIAWTRLKQQDWNKEVASWSWSVDTSVPATDLSVKGGDDRNISLYFVFLPLDEAQRLQGASLRRLLGNDQVRILQYAWGGNHTPGQFIPSPYGPQGQGVTVALRPAGTGSFNEHRSIRADYTRAFGHGNAQLVGLAVSADSDDTNTQVRAGIWALELH